MIIAPLYVLPCFLPVFVGYLHWCEKGFALLIGVMRAVFAFCCRFGNHNCRVAYLNGVKAMLQVHIY
jgi:hypothetical protein